MTKHLEVAQKRDERYKLTNLRQDVVQNNSVIDWQVRTRMSDA